MNAPPRRLDRPAPSAITDVVTLLEHHQASRRKWLYIGGTAPDFQAETEGDRLPRLDRGLVGSAVLAPGDFAVLRRARLHGEGEAGVRRRNVKVIGLSVDPIDRHAGWAADIEETQGAPTPDHRRRGLQGVEGLRDAGALSRATRRAARRSAATVRGMFVVGPDRRSSSSSSTG